MVKVAVVGVGYWGPNFVRIMDELPGAKLAAVCDTDSSKFGKLANLYPHLDFTDDLQSVIKDSSIDAVVVATSSDSHYPVAREALKSGKHVQGISNEAMTCLMSYGWPGNVRELKSTFEYAFVSCQESLIQPYHLPQNIFRDRQDPGGPGPGAANRDAFKKRQLLEALEKTGGNQSEAARMLGVSRVTIWNRMKKYGIGLSRRVGA